MSDRKRIILAVDDMPENLMTIASILNDFFDVRLAKSAEMALTLLKGIKVDLILLDIEMPEMSGFDFLNELQIKDIKNRKTPVVFVTSHADADLIGRAISVGAKDYLLKPIKAETLYKKIDSIIGLPKYIPHSMERKLEKLARTANIENKVQTENLIKEIAEHAQKEAPNIFPVTEEIRAHILKFEYDEAVTKIKELLEKGENYRFYH